MKIYYDHQMFSLQKFGGITTYFAQLMAHLPDGLEAVMATRYSDNIYLNERNYGVKQLAFPKNYRIKRRLYYFLNDRQHHRTIRKADFDIYHPTYYDVANTKKPTVITIHDLIHEKFPLYFSKIDQGASLKAKAIKRADHIICVSEHTKKDLLNIYHIDPKKVSTVYHGYDFRTKGHADQKENYLLYVGDRGGYKNFDNFILGVAELLNRDPTLQVICTGKPFNGKEVQLFNRLGIQDQVSVRTSIDSGALLRLYRKAKAFVYPSLYEGFGIPILEAFSQSCPVLLSNASCFPEIAKDGAIYFDPHSPEAIGTAVETVLNDADLTKKNIENANLRLQDFSVEKMAQKTSEVYRLFV